MTKIEDVYCKPKTEEDWESFDLTIIGKDIDFKKASDVDAYNDENYEVFYLGKDYIALAKVNGKLTPLVVGVCKARGSESTMISEYKGDTYPIKTKNKTEISVERFVDLSKDRITGWRLEEVGFKDGELPYMLKVEADHFGDSWNVQVSENGKYVFVDGKRTYITTFTELLTQLKFLGI